MISSIFIEVIENDALNIGVSLPTLTESYTRFTLNAFFGYEAYRLAQWSNRLAEKKAHRPLNCASPLMRRGWLGLESVHEQRRLT